MFVPSGDRATLEGIGAAALSLVGDRISTFADTVERGIAAAHRRKTTSTAVAIWLAARLMINTSFVVGARKSENEVLELLRLLKEFDPKDFGEVLVEQGTEKALSVAFSDGQLHFLNRPIDRLASGYVALLKILQEIVSSIAAWEAMRESTDIRGSDALVFIDEIDAHLHPRWQRNLLPFLKRMFPKATFVVTTHSPLIVRDTEPGEAYELVRNDTQVTVRRLGSPRDWYLSDVLADGFHVQLPSPGTEVGEGLPSLVDQLLEYADHVRQYAATKDPALREKAVDLHAKLTQRLPEDDPRRRSVAELRELLG